MPTEAMIEDGMLHRIREMRDIDFAQQQVYVSGKRIDIIYKTKESDDLTAIEVKIRDWKSALRQANLNKFAVSYSYVAIWREFAKPVMDNIESFAQLGVGVIVIDNDYSMSTLLKAYTPSVSLSESYQLNLRSSLIGATVIA